MLATIKKIVYPRGKVNPNYGRYVGWSCFSNFIVSIESVLSTHSMLSVVGQASSELTFSVNYIGKDIVGQLGGLYYMNRMGEKADKDSSKFIKYSMAFQQSAIFMECATPLLPISTFIPVAGLANVGKNIAFTGVGAVNARIISRLAEENNIGEIYAKISVLNTLGSTIGMGLGLVIAAHMPDHTMRLGLMPFLTVIRIYSYTKAIDELV
jgi:glutamate N-acetyltransferase/amino-acid N-acetyltransferase